MPQKLAEMEEKNAPINGEHSSGKASCLESSIEALERCRAGEMPRCRVRLRSRGGRIASRGFKLRPSVDEELHFED
jgi:hypothetical protein